MERQFHRNESSWNVRSRGTKVPRERMFHGTKVLGTFAPEERKFQGANVPWNESSTGAKVLSVDFSLPGTKVQRNEKAWNHTASWVGCGSGVRVVPVIALPTLNQLDRLAPVAYRMP